MCVAAELVNLLRIVVNDLADSQRYTDEKLSQVLVAAMYYVAADTGVRSYVANASTIDITPSPAADVAISNLLILKANCLMDSWELRGAARKAGLSFQEFSSKVDTKGIGDVWVKIFTLGACKTYEETLFSYIYGDGSMGTIIMTPFRAFYTSDYYSAPR